MERDIAVVGGGVLGVTTAYWLSELYDCSIALLDSGNGVALHTTLRNTGIVHRPYYLDPVKKRGFARSAERSYHLWKRLADKYSLPWRETGTLMVATEEAQLGALRQYADWGLENGLEEGEYSLLDARGVSEVEPEVNCHGAILSRRDASTDYAELTRAVWAMASENRAKFVPGKEVRLVEAEAGQVSVSFSDGSSMTCSLLINAAGGGSLDIAHMMGLAGEYTDLHFRGDYWNVDSARAPKVSRNVYSVARHGEFPFLDPHFIVRADGRMEVGPNAALVSGPYAYEGLGGARQMLAKIAERPIAPKAKLFINTTFLSLLSDEWHSSISKAAMCNRVKRFIPALEPEMLTERGLSGVRSSLIGKEGFVDEALIIRGDNSLHVLNYNSPGATGAPVFSAYLVSRLEKEGYLDRFKARPRKKGIWDYEAALVERA